MLRIEGCVSIRSKGWEVSIHDLLVTMGLVGDVGRRLGWDRMGWEGLISLKWFDRFH